MLLTRIFSSVLYILYCGKKGYKSGARYEEGTMMEKTLKLDIKK
jgi:hypothetical protein